MLYVNFYDIYHSILDINQRVKINTDFFLLVILPHYLILIF
jgi:hypothetical protein